MMEPTFLYEVIDPSWSFDLFGTHFIPFPSLIVCLCDIILCYLRHVWSQNRRFIWLPIFKFDVGSVSVRMIILWTKLFKVCDKKYGCGEKLLWWVSWSRCDQIDSKLCSLVCSKIWLGFSKSSKFMKLREFDETRDVYIFFISKFELGID